MNDKKQIKKLNLSNTPCFLPQVKKLGFAGYFTELAKSQKTTKNTTTHQGVNHFRATGRIQVGLSKNKIASP
jgi:glucan biosynthesis protein